MRPGRMWQRRSEQPAHLNGEYAGDDERAGGRGVQHNASRQCD